MKEILLIKESIPGYKSPIWSVAGDEDLDGDIYTIKYGIYNILEGILINLYRVLIPNKKK